MTDMVEAMARAIWTAYSNSQVPPEDLRGITWEQLTRWAKERPRLQEIVDLCLVETRAAIRACHEAGGLVLREVPGPMPFYHDDTDDTVSEKRGYNNALASVRARAVEVE